MLVAERARELSPKAFASDSSQLWPDAPVSPPATGYRPGRPALLTATSVFGGAPRGGISPSDPLLPPRALLAILRFQPSTDCSSASGSPLGSALRYPPTPRRPAEGEGRAPGQPSPAAGFGESEVRRHRALELCTSSSSESSRKVPQLPASSLPPARLPAGLCQLECEPARLTLSLSIKLPSSALIRTLNLPWERSLQEWLPFDSQASVYIISRKSVLETWKKCRRLVLP